MQYRFNSDLVNVFSRDYGVRMGEHETYSLIVACSITSSYLI